MHFLLKYRHKHQRSLTLEKRQLKQEGEKEALKNKPELNESELEEQNEKELEETIKRVERDRKRQDKKEREKKLKNELRQKMSVIASTDINNQTDDVLFDKRTLEKLKEIDIENLDYDQSEESEEEQPADH